MPQLDHQIYILENINITSLLRAKKGLDEGLAQIETVWTRDATIKRFELTFEQIWKTLKRILNKQGIEVNSPRETFRIAAREGLIENPRLWFHFLENRNLAAHTYNEEMAETLYAQLPEFQKEIEIVCERIRKL